MKKMLYVGPAINKKLFHFDWLLINIGGEKCSIRKDIKV